ncbi:MAG: ribokinase [Erysipelotrichaceae bacterium]
MKKLLVIGSINIDIYQTLTHFPQKGETIIAENSSISFGGKGANQAVAASKLGVETSFLGAIGNDIYKDFVVSELENVNINHDALEVIDGSQTGVANVFVSENDNIIVVNKGANNYVDATFIKSKKSYIKNFDYIMLQNEIDNSALAEIVKLKQVFGFKIIYNPAPFISIKTELYKYIDWITPNEEEYEKLPEIVKKEYSDKLIVTRGSTGVEYKGNIYDGLSVPVVDTTGAGDCFNGAFAALLIKGFTIEEAASFAAKAASISITQKGAQTGYLNWDEFESKVLMNRITT